MILAYLNVRARLLCGWVHDTSCATCKPIRKCCHSILRNIILYNWQQDYKHAYIYRHAFNFLCIFTYNKASSSNLAYYSITSYSCLPAHAISTLSTENITECICIGDDVPLVVSVLRVP